MPIGNAGTVGVSYGVSEIEAIRGYEFEGNILFDLTQDVPKYISFEVSPAASNKFVALRGREFKCDEPDVLLEILWYTTSITGGIAIPIFNSHEAIAAGNTSIVTYKQDPTVVEGGSVVIRETDFIPSGGQGVAANSSGQLDPVSAYRIYRAGSNFGVKLTSAASGTNRTKLGYKWAELPLNVLNR